MLRLADPGPNLRVCRESRLKSSISPPIDKLSFPSAHQLANFQPIAPYERVLLEGHELDHGYPIRLPKHGFVL